jgi:hypothetical protein
VNQQYPSLLAPAPFDITEKIVERLTDQFGPVWAEIRRQNLSYTHQFQNLEQTISRLLQQQELKAQSTGAESRVF